MSTRPNILLIVTDQQRPDFAGQSDIPVRTPHFDRLVERGVGFTNAILIQRENPALPVSDECSDALSEPRSEQGGSESRKLCATDHRSLPGRNPNA